MAASSRPELIIGAVRVLATNKVEKMRRTTILLSLASACIYHPACAEETKAESGPFASQNFSSTIYLMNDYRFRGISNSDGPAIQGSLDWTYNGFYLGEQH